MTVSEILDLVEERLTSLEIKMAETEEECEYRYLEGQLFILELLKEHMESLEE